MAFPKSPSKPISGNLRIVIRKPTEVELEAGPTPELPPGPDDAEIKFKLPAGFGMDKDLSTVLEKQLVIAHKSVTEIEDRYKKCGSCRKKDYNPSGIVDVRKAIDLAGHILKGKLTSPSRVVLAHEKNGDISLEISHQDRTVIVNAAQGATLLGKYERHVIVGSARFSREEFEPMLNWIVGHE